MSIIDIILISLFIAGVVIGAKNGAVKQISSIGGVLSGIVICRLFGDFATDLLMKIVPETKALPFFETTTSILANILLFLFVYLTVLFTGTMIKSTIRSLSLGGIDRVIGAIFCTFKFYLGLSLVLNLWFILSPKSEIFTSSKLLGGKMLRIVLDIAPWLFNSKIIPDATDTIEKIIT